MSRRIQRVNQLIKREISQVILREFEAPKDVLVTVTRVETTPDLRQGRVFIGVIPEENKDKVIDSLNKKVYFLQQKINKRLKMKNVPKMRFVEEKRTAEAARIERVLEGLKNEGE
ncbi:MAG: 30S ribosome-binding factor RbfA [Patescibacteria group bacterium]|nr:30S ribosome-binding factor RbfA [Patescibacteria group bacterium]